MSAERSAALAKEALERAVTSQAMSNLPAVYHGFLEMGIPEEDIKPRENVFTLRAWNALGRKVKKGEHGVRLTTWTSVPEKQDPDGNITQRGGSRPRPAYVFHISQTEKF